MGKIQALSPLFSILLPHWIHRMFAQVERILIEINHLSSISKEVVRLTQKKLPLSEVQLLFDRIKATNNYIKNMTNSDESNSLDPFEYTGSSLEGLASRHRTYPLFDEPMVLLHDVVEILDLPPTYVVW